MKVLHESIWIFKGSQSLNFRHIQAKFKTKVLDVSDFNENIETSWKSKL